MVRNLSYSFGTPELGDLFGQAWLPEGEPLGVLALIHGISEHSARYAHVAEWFAERGYALFAYDQFGHGRSPGKRGDIPGYDAIMSGVDRFLAEVQARAPGVPIFLYGHSLGGNYALNYLLRRRPSLGGVIATSPWLGLAFEPPGWKLALARLCVGVWPSLTQRNGLDATTLTRGGEPKSADPLGHDRISVRLFHAVRQSGDWVLQHAPEASAHLRIPILLMHGTEDAITSLAATRALASSLQGDVTYREWIGYRHELHNEPTEAREPVLHTMLDWLESKQRNDHAALT